MAAPTQSPEQRFRLRKFQGTNTDIDSTFLGPSLVSRSENWVPTQSYRLGKRPGTTFLGTADAGGTGVATQRITDLLAAHDGTHHYLFAYCRANLGCLVQQSLDEGPFTWNTATDPGVSYPATPTPGRMVLFRDRVYVGNGVDPIKSWKLGDPPANTLTFGAIADLTGTPAIPVDPPGGPSPTIGILTGSYQYCWAVFNNQTGLYVSRSAAAEVSPAAGQILRITSPATVLPANQVYRFFIAPRGFPIEYATAQGPDAPGGSVTRDLNTITVTDLRVPLYGGTGLFRTGNMLLVWRNRVVFAGMRDDPCAVFSTDTILPGLEQKVFNQGTMFPVNAKVMLPAPVTGVGMAGVTTDQDAFAPLLFFTRTRTFLCMGDPFSTVEQAELREISSRVGCIAHDSIVNTPIGTIFAGIDSIYLVPPGGGYPQDIGWPIADQIRHIMHRDDIFAVFHKQFYKLSLPDTGEGWWLDLRQGLSTVPSWWGPMTTLAETAPGVRVVPTAATVTFDSPTEPDRGYLALLPNTIIRTHQLFTYADYNPRDPGQPIRVRSVLKSGRFDADDPFIAKIFTRLRLIAQTAGKSQIDVFFETDGGTPWQIDPILLGEGMDEPGQFVSRYTDDPVPYPVPPGPPSFKSWNHDPLPPGSSIVDTLGTVRGKAQFVVVAPVEVQTITPAIRPRGLSAVITLTHDPVPKAGRFATPNVELRDFELLFIPSERKVRYLNERVGR